MGMIPTMFVRRPSQGIPGNRAGCIVYDERGQMTVEFVAAFPVMVIVAVILVNALLFFSECAAFDRVARDAVRIYATSPGYGKGADQGLASIRQCIDASFTKENLSTAVEVSEGSGGLRTYKATLRFSPTLFGMGLRSSVLGVSLPGLEHSVSMTVDTYKPGVLL